ncbi:hypothetical protein [Curtobacterium aetherium]|uniref:Uncharacterized protein n=1 Tax=Curtobacterium aetherium TaxID=2841594 RepID=A0ACD1E5H4_9MICO|nr:hypothetical protein [Curtobacterium sp. L6-1]QWS34043.1 hypothetical protein KM842_02235 [Curtobacterium sp. L6-1]
MPSEMSHEQWVARTRRIERINQKQRDLLMDLRADLMAQVRRLDRILSHSTSKTPDRKDT